MTDTLFSILRKEGILYGRRRRRKKEISFGVVQKNKKKDVEMKIRRLAAVWTSKLAGYVCKKMGKQGVTWAGKIALKIYPNILRELAGEVREGIFAVCGTNGKTTTNNLLCSVLEANGQKVVCNHTGSNMLNGVVAAFVLKAKLNGHLDADYACIEIDEASTVRVFPYFKPDYMILTNLFRDQLDRYGEIDITMKLLARAMEMAPRMELLVNGDDSLSAYLAMEGKNSYKTYGISEKVLEEDAQEIREGRFCKRCGAKMEYDFYHYSQLGLYHCPQCGFSRPVPDYDGRNVDMAEGLAFDVGDFHIKANYRGFYNIYNILAVYGAVDMAGISRENFNEVLGAQDGTDVSWLWDVDFDRLRDAQAASITVSGIRCYDMRLRLKYVEIESRAEPDVEKAILSKLKEGTGNLYLLVNYTGLYTTHNILKKMEEKA